MTKQPYETETLTEMIQPGVKIAIVSASSPPYINGGISSAHFNLHKALSKKGYLVKSFTFLDHANQSSNNEIERFGSPSFILKLLTLFDKVYKFLLRKVETFQFAYQFPYCLEAAVGSWKISRALKRYSPDVLILSDNGSPGFFIKKTAHCKTVMISHHNYLRFVEEPLFGVFSKIDAKLANSLESKSLKKIDAIICPSHFMQDFFNKTHSFPGPVDVVPNLVDAELIDSTPATDVRKLLDIQGNAPVIFIPSGGTPFKGSRYVYELIRRLSFLHESRVGFVISGGITDNVLAREIDFLPENAKIFMTGACSYIENIAILKSCDVCVSPTLIESFGMAILEANFCSLPVVTFDVGGSSEVVTDGINGYLTSFLDMEKIVSCTDKLLRDHQLLVDMKESSRRHANDHFSADIVADRYEKAILGRARL